MSERGLLPIIQVQCGLAGVVRGEGAVGVVVLFRVGLRRRRSAGRGRSGWSLFCLLFGVAFGDDDDAVAGGEVGEGVGYAGEEFDLLIGDGLGEADDAVVFLGGEGAVGELLEAGDEGLAEAVEAVAAGADGGVLDAVEMVRGPLRRCGCGGRGRR